MAAPDMIEELSCSICQSIYTDPVMLTCGHNYCRHCIKEVLKFQRQWGLYTCPECRTEFQKQPQLQENTKLRNVAKLFLSTQREDSVVYCTYCVRHPVPAVRACVLCEAALCDHHLGLHSKSAEHVLSEPGISFSGRICYKHKRVLKYYCVQDRACLCAKCSSGKEHWGHQVESLGVAADKKKEKLEKILETLREKRERISDQIRQLQTAQSELARKVCHVDLLRKAADPLRVLQERESDRDDFCHVGGIDKDKRLLWFALVLTVSMLICGIIAVVKMRLQKPTF